MKAFTKYYLDINSFNLIFSIIIGLISSILWSVVIFSSIGIIIGLLIYKMFKSNEYYTYYNLGYTKENLIKKVWIINLTISISIFLIYSFLK